MIKSKKGVEIALNVVIIAVIALLVLVIVIFIFSSRANLFNKGVSDCAALGGECSDTNCLVQGRPAITNGDCNVEKGAAGPYCCSKAFK